MIEPPIRPTDAEIYEQFHYRAVSISAVAQMNLKKATRMVAFCRKKRLLPGVEDVGDEDLARIILAFARGQGCLETRQLWFQTRLIDEARLQTQYLKSMNTVIQIWGVLLILGIILAACSILGITDALF